MPTNHTLKPASLREDHRKPRERAFLDRFLTLSNWKVSVEKSDESPDFIVSRDGKPLGVEITELLTDADPKRGGSAKKAGERLRAKWLARLAADYYAAGGQPVDVKALLPAASLPTIVNVSSILLEDRAKMRDWETQPVELTGGEVFHLRALPAAAGQYARWNCISDAVGWVATIPQESLEAAVAIKAAKLPRYQAKSPRVVLLIVADRLTNAGRWQLAPNQPAIEARGFDEVHVLIYPDETVRIDRGAAF